MCYDSGSPKVKGEVGTVGMAHAVSSGYIQSEVAVRGGLLSGLRHGS